MHAWAIRIALIAPILKVTFGLRRTTDKETNHSRPGSKQVSITHSKGAWGLHCLTASSWSLDFLWMLELGFWSFGSNDCGQPLRARLPKV